MTDPVSATKTTVGAGEALAALRAWWHAPAGRVAPVVWLTGPPSPLKTQVLDVLAAEAGAGTEVIRVEAPSDPAATLRMSALQDDVMGGVHGLPEGSGPPASRLVLVDDLDLLIRGFGGHGTVLFAARASDALDRLGCRMVVASVRDTHLPVPSRTLTVEVRERHRRVSRLDRITGWASDRSAHAVMLVTGASGTGKSFLLDDAAEAIAVLPAVRIAHCSVRDWTRRDPPTWTAPVRLIQDMADAFDAEGMSLTGMIGSLLTGRPQPVRDIDISVVNNHGSVVGEQVTAQEVAGAAAETLYAALAARAAQGLAGTTLVMIVDALDEWEAFGAPALRTLRGLLGQYPRFAEWNLKVLVASQYRPDWLEAAEEVHLGDGDAVAEIVDFASTGLLEVLPDDESDRRRKAERVAELSGGLFLVAAGYLHELRKGILSPDGLAGEPVAENAVQYHRAALSRLRRHYEVRQELTEWRSMERFLAMLSVLPHGRSLDDLLDAWEVADLPVNPDGLNALDRIAAGPLRPHYTVSGEERTYRLGHSSLREAVLGMEPSDHRTGPHAERRRWILTRTPLGPSGAAWDPVAGRAALADVGTVIADALRDRRKLQEARIWARTLLERWDWAETCVAHPGPDGTLPLGPSRVVHQIEAMVGADPSLAEQELWTAPDRPDSAPEPAAAHASAPSRPSGLAAQASPSAVKKPSRAGTSKPFYARAGHKLIEEVLIGAATFATRAEAVDRLDRIRATYTTAKEDEESRSSDHVTLYILDHGLTEEDRKGRVRGKYSRLSVRRDTVRWSLLAEPDTTPRGDPYPPRPDSPNPNWGADPLISRLEGNPRRQKSLRTFATHADAHEALQQLRGRYPKAVVEQTGKFSTHVYDPLGPLSPDTGRCLSITETALLIVPVPGGFQIQARIIGYKTGRKGQPGYEFHTASEAALYPRRRPR